MWRSGTVVDKAYLIVAGTAVFLAGRRNARSMGSAAHSATTAAAAASLSDLHFESTRNLGQRRTTTKNDQAIRLVREEEENDYTVELKDKSIFIPKKSSDDELLWDTDQVKKEFGNDSDSSISSDAHEGSTGTIDLDNSLSTCGASVDLENIKLLVQGFKKKADCVNNEPMRMTSDSSTESSPSLSLAEHGRTQSSKDRFANKVLGRLYTRKKFSSNLVFSRGHFLGDVSKMVAGLLSGESKTDESKTDESSGDDEGFQYGYGDKPMISDRRGVATIHERAGDEHIVHNSTLVAGKDGCVVLVVPKSKIIPFLDQYPGLLLSLLGTQVVV